MTQVTPAISTQLVAFSLLSFYYIENKKYIFIDIIFHWRPMYRQSNQALQVLKNVLRNAVCYILYVERRSFQGHLTQKLQIKPRDRNSLFEFLN